MAALKIAGVCLLSLLPWLIVRRHLPELGLALLMGAVAITAAALAGSVAPLIQQGKALLEQAGLSGEYAGILLKTVACVLVSRVCADLCRDGGSHALAGMAELAGAVAVLVIALPLFRAVAELLLGLMGGGI